ncbi:hypothetical protein DFH28DRAFT_902754 [Melampsora americana]|nr:hypothetical protein DFH28DRAFT_902754 [Melampsora americana]
MKTPSRPKTSDKVVRGETTKPERHDQGINPYHCQLAPPAWQLRGEAWWLVLSLFGKPQNSVASDSSQINSKLQRNQYQVVPAHFDLVSSRQSEATHGVFCGGAGTVQIIRYHSSPVGPYDELMIVPGEFSLPKDLGASSLPKITRVYVSSLQSVYNGRTHWNVPKNLAHFEFISEPSGSVTIEIYALESYTFASPRKGAEVSFQPTFAPNPFFSATFHLCGPETLRIPMRASLLPGVCTTLAQPPLKEGDVSLGYVGTSTWKKFPVDISGRIGLRKAEGSLVSSDGIKRFGDGEGFPDFKPYTIGVHWKDALFDIGKPSVYSEKNLKR